MAALTTIIAGAALATAAVGTATSIKSGKQAARYQRDASAMQQKQADLQNARNKREAIREARMAYGRAQNSAANQGVSDSSGSQGGLSSIASQAADNVSFLDQYGFFSDQASRSLGRASAAQSRANTGAAIANLGFQVAGNAVGLANTFAPSPGPAPVGGN
jgi:hypothetical protein